MSGLSARPAPDSSFELAERGADTPKGADFAVRLTDAEPVIKKGGTAYISASAELCDGDVGIFLVGDQMLCRQYCEDSFGNIYLFALDRRKKELDVTIRASSGLRVICFGKVLLPKKLPLPRD